MQNPFHRSVGALVLTAGALGLAACGRDALPTANEPSSQPQFTVGAVTTDPTPELGKIKLCKAGDTSGNFTITRVAVGGGTGTVQAAVTIAAGDCVVVAEDNGTGGDGSNVTFTESPATNLTGVTGQRIDTPGGVSDACVGTPNPCANPGTTFLNSFHGSTFTFTNTAPPVVGQGCSPGYWKNHTTAWPAPYTPEQLFTAAGFDDAFVGKTLLQVLGLHGGGLNALGRQTVSALLNAAAGIGFEMTPAQVISAFNNAHPGTKAEYNTLKNTFEALTDVNGRICPLN